jgi:hypothetical protein
MQASFGEAFMEITGEQAIRHFVDLAFHESR